MKITQLLTPEQISKLLQVHHLTVLKLIKDGEIRAVRLGRVYRVQEEAFAEFLVNNQTVKKSKKTKI